MPYMKVGAAPVYFAAVKAILLDTLCCSALNCLFTLLVATLSQAIAGLSHEV